MPAATVFSVAVLAAACGGDDSGENAEAAGSINVSGSSTVEPITALVAEEFSSENPDVDIAVDGPGTGDGFEVFCRGETDISDASRPIDDEEAANCDENGIEYVELEIGYDGMAVLTNANNEAIQCLSFADLYALIGPESEGFETWTDATELAADLGSDTEFPDAPLDLTGPGTESGTYDSFVEVALEGIAEERGLHEDKIGTTRTDYKSNADDNVIISNIEASDSSLGWVGFAFAENAGDHVVPVPISEAPGGECVEPSVATIAEGTYPLSRSLYIYVNTAKAEENDALSAFVDFYLADLNTFVETAGYVPLPEEKAEETVSAWEGR